MKIGIAADHGGFTLKIIIHQFLKNHGYEVIDFGAAVQDDTDDYPDFVIPLAEAVANNEVNRGIAICGSGVGAAIAANKVMGVRAALINDYFSAHQGVEDDDMNLMCLGGRVTGFAAAQELVIAFLNATFTGAERHIRRLQKVKNLEKIIPNSIMVKHIHDFGQSIWLDFFDRKIMDSGALQKLIDEDGIRGVTSNPAIFEKAISASDNYDADISALSKQKISNDKIFYAIAVKDIQRAVEFFKHIYDQSHGEDGFVSLEVSPHLSRDTEGTIKQARELWYAVGRKNVMIKIPGTAEGLPAIRKCIGEGINVNVTLLFGLTRYKEVTDAYIAGLEDRVKSHQSINEVASVASFFLSRIDAMIDPMLKEKGVENIMGEVAIASAKGAYQIYQDTFYSERFKKLEAHGAKRQRVLWASTGTKDPSMSDVKYVEALIGKETVNTIPFETLEAFRHHGNAANRLEDGMNKATNVLAQLKEMGIDIDTITQKLEDEGIAKFNQPYDKLLNVIETKKNKINIK